MAMVILLKILLLGIDPSHLLLVYVHISLVLIIAGDDYLREGIDRPSKICN